MAQAPRDNNGVTTLLCTSNGDGSTPVAVQVDPTAHGIYVDNNTTGSDLSGDIAARDQNAVPVAMGVSSADGVTPTPIYADPATGFLLINSTP